MSPTITDTLISVTGGGSLSLAYAKDHIRALANADDLLIATYIEAAASYFEEQTGRQLLTATREAWLDAFPFVGLTGADARIELPRPPLQTVVSIKYVDPSGVLQTMAGGSPLANLFRVSAPAGAYARRGFVEPLYGQPWPVARAETGAVRIQYTCGYGASTAIPPLVSGILCFLVGHFDTFRSAVVDARNGQLIELPYGVQMMMDGFKYSAYPSQVLRSGLENALAAQTVWRAV